MNNDHSRLNGARRLIALDVFRGLTIALMIIVNTPGSWAHLYAPLRHAEWHGCTPTDLVFPFFLFSVGVSMSLSFRKFQTSNRSTLFYKIIKRTVLIFLIGLLLQWFPFYHKHLLDLRVFGVLQRIALAYGLASVLILMVRNVRSLYVLCAAILVIYHVVLIQFGGEAPLSLEDNAVRRLDLFLFGDENIYTGYGIPFDPEGLLSTLPSVSSVLIGYFIGRYLTNQSNLQRSLSKLIGASGVLIIAGLIWHCLGFPINKPIWSSSYVLFTSGIACLLLSVLLWLIDIKKVEKWSNPFQVFGQNPLFSFILSILFIKIFYRIKIDGTRLYTWVFENALQPTFNDNLASLIQALVYMFFILLLVYPLFKRRIFIRV